MEITVNDIAFGNPTNAQRLLIAKPSFLNKVFDEFIGTPIPLNDSSITKEELNEISERIADISDDLNKEHLHRYLYSDQNFAQFLVNNLKSKNLDLIELYRQISEDVDPLIMKLKFRFNRPRPAQLASYYKLNLFPYNLSKIDTPSFPSRTVILSFLICEIVGNRVPTLYEQAQTIKEYIASSRSYLGVNYITDIEFANQLGEAIITDPEFTKKYQI